MNHTNIRYIPIEKNTTQKSLLFQVQLAPKPDGNWIAWIGALPGCAAWGATKDDALAMGVIAPFPNLTSPDVGTYKELSLTV